jgi:predicted TIM-barrel fold metal-dependent hydrolase
MPSIPARPPAPAPYHDRTASEDQAMRFIDAHAHVWTPDTIHYPLAKGYRKEDMKPASFTADELMKHAKAAGADRVNLIQMSYYGFDNP